MRVYSTSTILQQCAGLAQASDYNLFTLRDVRQSNSNVEGRASVGGNADFSSFDIGSRLCNPPAIPCPPYGTDSTLVVGGDLTWTDGTNISGNTVMTTNGSYNVTNVFYNNADASIQPVRTSSLPVDFQASFDYFLCAAEQWAEFSSPNNTTIVINCYGNVYLIGLNTDINIFNISATNVAPGANVIGGGNNTFSQISSLTVVAPENSTILINVEGQIINFGNYSILRSTNVPSVLPVPSADTCNQLPQGNTPGAAEKQLIFWNFYNATAIVTSNASFQGTVFAPNATIYTVGGNIEGAVIAVSYRPSGSLTNHTEVHNYLFRGCLPEVFCSTTTSSTTSSTTTSSTTTSTSSTTTSSSSTTTTSTTTYPYYCCRYCCPYCRRKLMVWRRNNKVYYYCLHCGYYYISYNR